MNVLVIGGTGYIGPYVVERLLAKGCRVTVLHRGKTNNPLPTEVDFLIGERGHLADRRPEFEALKLHAVVDIAPYTEAHANELVSAFRGIAERLAILSSVDVYRAFGVLTGNVDGPPEPDPISEESPLREGFYLYADPSKPPDDFWNLYEKIIVERIVLGQPDWSGSVVRLPMTYGPRDRRQRFVETVRRMAAGRPAVLLAESLSQWVAPRGYVENIAEAVALAAIRPEADGQIFNVADPDPIPEVDWVKSIGAAVGWEGRVEIVPDASMPAALKPEGRFDQSMSIDSRKIRSLLGFREVVDLEEGLRRTVAYDLAHLPTDPIDYAEEDAALANRISVP